MDMKMFFAMSSAAAAMALCAVAAPPKVEPVAAGFPQWQGMTPKSYIRGREITAADLRHRVTIVVDVDDNADLHKQLLEAAGLVQLTGLTSLGFEGGNWETMTLPRDVLIVVSCHGLLKNPDALKTALKSADQSEAALAGYSSARVPFYEGISFAGGPETEGKRPYIYVMGPTGTEPVMQGKLDAAGVKAARAAAVKAKAKFKETPWKQFYGTEDPAKFPSVAAAIAKGKPLGPVAVAIQKDVLSKDAEKAQAAQVVSDALSQTRSDLLFRIRLEAQACPHRAYYDFQQLVKFWPSEKKKLDDVMLKLKAIPDGEKLAKMFCKAMAWSEPDFVCKSKGEATKIVKELQKMKIVLEKLKESKVIVIQNGALLMDSQIDMLIATIPDKVAGK